jgi:flagellar L-ring protein precursor FlgH
MRRFLAVAFVVLGATRVGAQQAPAAPLDLGWLADGRRFHVGDIVTVLVDEYTLATADRETSALEDRSTEAGGGFTVNDRSADGSLNTFLGNESTRRGRDARQDRLTSEVSVRVVEVEPNGSLRVEGSKTLVIDEHEQAVTVRGVIRPQDINALNTIDSWRVAEAEILYDAEGSLGKAEKSIWARFLGWIF